MFAHLARSRFPGPWRGKTVIGVTDSLGLYYAITRGRAPFGSPMWSHVEEAFRLADAHGVTLLALWVPRTALTASDALSHHRAAAAARAWAAAAGLPLTVI